MRLTQLKLELKRPRLKKKKQKIRRRFVWWLVGLVVSTVSIFGNFYLNDFYNETENTPSLSLFVFGVLLPSFFIVIFACCSEKILIRQSPLQN